MSRNLLCIVGAGSGRAGAGCGTPGLEPAPYHLFELGIEAAVERRGNFFFHLRLFAAGTMQIGPAAQLISAEGQKQTRTPRPASGGIRNSFEQREFPAKNAHLQNSPAQENTR